MAISVEIARIPNGELSASTTEYRSYTTTSKEGVIETFAAPLEDLERQAHTTSKTALDEIVRKGLDVYCNESFLYTDRIACLKRFNPPRIHIVASKAGEIIKEGLKQIEKEKEEKLKDNPYSYH